MGCLRGSMSEDVHSPITLFFKAVFKSEGGGIDGAEGGFLDVAISDASTRNVRFLYCSVGFAALSPKTHFDAPRRVSLLLQQRGWNDADRVRAGFDDRAES
jgi:hypothetical protein